MEFPELLSVLFYEDCSAQIPAELPRLKALAYANGTNFALILYLRYFTKVNQRPTPEQLVSFGCTVDKFSPELISGDLEMAAEFKKAGTSGFAMAMEEAWEAAGNRYAQDGYLTARSIAARSIPSAEIKKALTKLYGEDQDDWDFKTFARIWLTEYEAKDPFVKREEEEIDPANEHEYVFATGIRVEDDKVVNTKLTLINATDLKPEKMTWLWPDRIPQGRICWYTGKPNLGKSLATLDLIARITTGRDWPDSEKNLLPPQDVLLAISEDSLTQTVIPRLNAAGADLSHVKFFNRVILDDGSRHLQLASDMSALKRGLEANPSVTLVVLDPLESFSGDVDINRNLEIRPVTDALKRICEKTKVTLVGIVHDNKRSDVSAIQKIPGGSAVSGAARSALGFSRDPDNPNEYYMSMVKGNLSKKQTGLKYTIGEKEVDGIKAPYIVWGEEHDSTADDLLNAERDTNGRAQNKQITVAREFLPQALAKGPRLAQELYDEAAKAGISSDTLKRAKRELGGITVYRLNNRWTWSNSSDDPIISDDDI